MSVEQILTHPPEFKEWLNDSMKNRILIMFRIRIPNAPIKYKFWGDKEEYSVDELYDYWLKNIKK